MNIETPPAEGSVTKSAISFKFNEFGVNLIKILLLSQLFEHIVSVTTVCVLGGII